jgi:hypothetical protein
MIEKRKRYWKNYPPTDEENDPDFYEYKCMKCGMWWGAGDYGRGNYRLLREQEFQLSRKLVEEILNNGHMWACDNCCLAALMEQGCYACFRP